jgi:hypothetical protein
MRSWYAALTVGFTMMALAACVTPSIPIPPPKGPPPRPGDPVVLPQALAKVSRVCRWAESAGNAPPVVQSEQKMSMVSASARHKHISIVNWKLVQEQTWIKMYPRQGSAVKFNTELSYSNEVDPTSGYSEMELLDFRLVNGDRPPATVKFDLTKDQLCAETAPDTVGQYFNGPLMLSVEPLQNAEETDISEHVLVYAPLRAELRDGVRDWWVFLIWHVRSKAECDQVKEGPDRESCLALLELADLDPSKYAERVPELLSRVKYPYGRTVTKSHYGVIHGALE